MDKLRKIRGSLRRQFTNLFKELVAELEKDDSNLEIIEVKFERISKIIEDLQAVDQQVLDLILDDVDKTEDDYNTVVESSEKYQQEWLLIKIRVAKALPSRPPQFLSCVSPTGSATSEGGEAKMRAFKLPKVELKKFSGELTDWLSWWSQFSKIDGDDTLHDTDKFQYLIQCMEKGTRARELVDSYPQTEENYPKVIKALKERFGKEKILKRVYVRELLKLVIKNNARELNNVSQIYDKLESHLRALESLGITSDQMDVILFPMVESCLPEEILIAWQRSANYGRDGKGDIPPRTEFQMMMDFIRQEVENENQRQLAQTGFSNLTIDKKEVKSKDHNSKRWDGKKNQQFNKQVEPPTAVGLFATAASCIFCDFKNHQSQDCMKARGMAKKEKNDKVVEKKACFTCLKPGHTSAKCKLFVKCFICQGKHHSVMCHLAGDQNKEKKNVPEVQQQQSFTTIRSTNQNKSEEILLKVAVVRVQGPQGGTTVRMLIDEGSQVSYVGTRTIQKTGHQPIGTEFVQNLLLGGVKTKPHHEPIHSIDIESLDGRMIKTCVLREKPIVCTSIPRVPSGWWIGKLRKKGIFLSDLCTTHVDEVDIEILIGSDLRGEIVTGRRINLGQGLVAEETIFGWVVSGPVPSHRPSAASVTVALSTQQAKIEDLWSLEAIGIKDPIIVKSQEEEETAAKRHFEETVRKNKEGRYSVNLPWISGSAPDIPNNKHIAEKRLHATTKKLVDKQMFDEYDKVIRSWMDEGIVEQVNRQEEDKPCHYLPHHPVFKPQSTTTPVRPVFDASCKAVGQTSINDCLYKGPNYLEVIPAVINRFREGRLGVVSDIRKAFQMVEVKEEDRDFQRFLWWEDYQAKKMIILRHARVVFGMTCSPFILGATLDFHLKQIEGNRELIAQKLLKSFYVDNSVTSVDTYQEYEEFRDVATKLLAEIKMELREWEVGDDNNNEDEVNDDDQVKKITSVLGLFWDKDQDTISCEVSPVIMEGPMTKRKILSKVHQVFDPIGFTSPATLQPKLLLQKLWETKVGWDEEIHGEAQDEFKKWLSNAHLLSQIKVPRRMFYSQDPEDIQLHLFTDASKYAYAAVIFARCVRGDEIIVRFVQSKSRVAPIKGGAATIPRLELMGCVIGARLLDQVVSSLELKKVKCFQWTDSTTALSWIKMSPSELDVFVSNRTKEIRKLTSVEEWRHVPGVKNPADLPSRGCNPKQLLESSWWEGPEWLSKPESEWPMSSDETNEEMVASEMKKIRKVLHCTSEKQFETKFSSYLQNVRVVAWMKRFINNCRNANKEMDEKLTAKEMLEAEAAVIKRIQEEDLERDHLKNLPVIEKDGLLCIKSKLVNKEDTEHFRFPIILPNNNKLVQMMIRDLHISSGHAGAQYLLCKLREKFWVLGGRRSVKSVIHKCQRCRRYDAKSLAVEQAALPKDRVTPGEVFQTTGVDLAGPLMTKEGCKVWIVLYTCAVYRCVHFDVVTSTSAEAFLGALERFINQYGRPSTMWSDNGTNFVGVANMFKALNWEKVEQTIKVKNIRWTFNPPSSPWWGGWWERLVRSMKNQLRRMLGNSRVTIEELRTCLSSVQATINDRPLTAMTQDEDDLIPITPAMFMHPTRSNLFPEGEIIKSKELTGAYKQMKKIQSELQQRFRTEYLAQLIQRGKEKKSQVPKVGDLVLIGSDNKKRIEWPMGRIVELIQGKDGHIRVAKLQTSHEYQLKTGDDKLIVEKVKRGRVITRPLQRLYPLEMPNEAVIPISKDVQEKANVIKEERQKALLQEVEDEENMPEVRTRAGRVVKQTSRYGKWISHISIMI